MSDVLLLRQLQPEDVVCPAGSCVGDASVFCRVEGGVIDGRVSPDSVEGFCCGEPARCPSWRLEKDRIAAGKKAASYVTEKRAEGEKEKARLQAIRDSAREERRHKARELLLADTPEARAFRQRIGVGLRRRGRELELVRRG